MIQKFLSLESRYQIREEYKRARKRLLLLDYDGTLTNITSHPDEARPDSRVHDLLNSLACDESNIVALLSGRSRHTLEAWFKNEKIIYGAEHGAMLKLPGEKDWILPRQLDTSWKPEVKQTLCRYTGLYNGSFVEEKEYSLVWHYRQCELKNESAQLAAIYRSLEKLDSSRVVDIRSGKKIIEVASPLANKGSAARSLLSIYQPGFALAIGDDTTDEDMFSSLQEANYYTIKVGLESTRARFCVINPGLALSFLEFLCS